MTRQVFLHVGPHKTGTTYVQGLLEANRERLAEGGARYPSMTFKRQGRAVKQAMAWRSRVPGRTATPRWSQLLSELQQWDGPTAVISHESISTASTSDIAHLVRRLAGFEAHVVYTARDLSRVAPAMWQTIIRSSQSVGWDEYARSLERPEVARGDLAKHAKRFWQAQDAAAVLARWHAHLPLDRLHVVTVPRPGNPPELLWQRFCSVLDVDVTGHDLTPRRSNPSLGTAETELMRRVNAAIADRDLARSEAVQMARSLGRELEARPDMLGYTLPAQDLAWISVRAHRIIDDVRADGYPVVGDLDDLVPQPVAEDQARHPSDTTEHAVLDVAVDSICRLLVRLADQRSGQRGRH